ncbi:hypothetical protein EYC80_003840 [Monilinia laxa]|uniref:Uncharacterized protein n=1 Tax=Monilinia laxa TaxID=61186 RepID=A0A5N6KL79_MONLA|nr:hypothetical protein EYC80_003840 [Monilinia laxa]
MLSKAINYGYVKQQVLDILSESHDRIELSTYKNIPDGERYWMAERWTWETLFADELATFPGKNPKWKGVEKYLKHMSPIAGEAPKNLQAEAVAPTLSATKYANLCNTLPYYRYFRIRVANPYIQRPSSGQAPKTPSMDKPRKSSGSGATPSKAGNNGSGVTKTIPSCSPVSVSASILPTSSANKRKRTERLPQRFS